MQSVTVIIILPLLCLANYDNMAVNQADSDYLLFECKKKNKTKQKEKQEKAFWLCDQYLAVSIPEQASGQSQSPGGCGAIAVPAKPGNRFIFYAAAVTPCLSVLRYVCVMPWDVAFPGSLLSSQRSTLASWLMFY